MAIEIKGLKQFKAQLEKLEKKTAKKIIKVGIKEGNKVILAAIKSNVPVATGTLKRAQTTKVIGKGLSLGGIVGANQDKLNREIKRPHNIDWLVEFGHVTPEGKLVPPTGFMRRAAAESLPQAEAAFIKAIKEELDNL